jgi:predicted ester cyclase
VVTRWSATGTHVEVLAGITPTGKRVTVSGIWLHRVDGGQIVESWNTWDSLGLLQQLGVVPALGQAPP